MCSNEDEKEEGENAWDAEAEEDDRDWSDTDVTTTEDAVTADDDDADAAADRRVTTARSRALVAFQRELQVEATKNKYRWLLIQPRWMTFLTAFLTNRECALARRICKDWNVHIDIPKRTVLPARPFSRWERLKWELSDADVEKQLRRNAAKLRQKRD
jgi:hypothetical protein